MNKKDLIVELSQKSGQTQSEVSKVLELLFAMVAEELAREERIVISGFGSFYVKNRAARTGLNPRNKEKIQIPATKIPTFKPGKKLKAKVCLGRGCSL